MLSCGCGIQTDKNRQQNERGDDMRKYGMLRERIQNVFGTQQAFAVAMGMNTATLNAKLNGKADWTSKEIEKACMLLNISMVDMPNYFFY